jgi:hypothetical protein
VTRLLPSGGRLSIQPGAVSIFIGDFPHWTWWVTTEKNGGVRERTFCSVKLYETNAK